jgi:hypothetical protein
MEKKKEYFPKPLVRAQTARMRFPRICPVCGKPATETARIEVAYGRKEYLLRSWDPYYSRYARRTFSSSLPPPKVLGIPVCEDHHFLDEGHERYRSLCLVIDGFSMAFMVFALLMTGDALWRGRAVGLVPIGFMLFFAASMIASIAAFRPTALQRAVRLVGFDSGMQNVLLLFENEWYRDEFIKENPMTSTLIRWIVRS